MSATKKIELFEKVNKIKSGIPVSVLKAVRIGSGENALQSAIDRLKQKDCIEFVVLDHEKRLKTLYNRVLNGKNYYKKVVNLD